jgi:hypothetical protein
MGGKSQQTFKPKWIIGWCWQWASVYCRFWNMYYVCWTLWRSNQDCIETYNYLEAVGSQHAYSYSNWCFWRPTYLYAGFEKKSTIFVWSLGYRLILGNIRYTFFLNRMIFFDCCIFMQPSQLLFFMIFLVFCQRSAKTALYTQYLIIIGSHL